MNICTACQSRERKARTIDERHLVTRPGIGLNGGHSSHLVNPPGDSKPYMQNVIYSSWEYPPRPLPGFQSIISRLSVARRVPERQRWRGPPLSSRAGRMVRTPGNHPAGKDWSLGPFQAPTGAQGPAAFCHQVRALPLVTLLEVKGPGSPSRRKSA